MKVIRTDRKGNIIYYKDDEIEYWQKFVGNTKVWYCEKDLEWKNDSKGRTIYFRNHEDETWTTYDKDGKKSEIIHEVEYIESEDGKTYKQIYISDGKNYDNDIYELYDDTGAMIDRSHLDFKYTLK